MCEIANMFAELFDFSEYFEHYIHKTYDIFLMICRKCELDYNIYLYLQDII